MFNIVMVGDRELVLKLRDLPTAIHRAILQMIERQTLALQAHVIRDKLSGQVLNVRTGALRRSIQAEVTDGQIIVGRVYSSGDVKYAAIHEFGGTTPPHDIVPTKAKALAFAMGGQMVFAKIVHHPGSKIPERSYLRSGLADRKQAIIDDARGTVEAAAQQQLAP